MVRRIGVILFAIVFARLAAAQTIDLREGPPVVPFADWVSTGSFDDRSEYEVAFPSSTVSPYPENNIVRLRVVVPKSGGDAKPAAILLHYWGASDQKAEVALAADLTSRGVASIMMSLPYHLDRTPKGFRSGELAIQPDPQKLIVTMRQSVNDVRRTIDWIMTRPELDKSRIAITGTSLGAIVATSTYAVEPRISGGAFVLGGGDIAHILWHSSRVVVQREALRKMGYTESRLRDTLAPIEPLNYLPRTESGRTLVVAGKFDTVVPPADVKKLIDRLPESQSLWLDTGHYGGIFVQRRVQRIVAGFLESVLMGSSYVVPKRIFAPTIRVGVSLSTSTKLQVGLGLDLWRSSNGAAFAGLFVTPKGPEGFIGYRMSQGLNFGGFVSNRRIGVGLMWNTVL